MKSSYKSTSTTMITVANESFDRMTGGWLEYGYCSTTVFNHRLIRLIRFGSQSCTYLQIFFANRLHLILHSCKILFSQKVFRGNQTWVTACLWKLISLSLCQLQFSKASTNFVLQSALSHFGQFYAPTHFWTTEIIYSPRNLAGVPFHVMLRFPYGAMKFPQFYFSNWQTKSRGSKLRLIDESFRTGQGHATRSLSTAEYYSVSRRRENPGVAGRVFA